MTDTINDKLSIIFKNLRISNKQRLSEVATSIGKTTKTVQLYETGEITMSLELIVKLCEHYGVEPIEILKQVL